MLSRSEYRMDDRAISLATDASMPAMRGRLASIRDVAGRLLYRGRLSFLDYFLLHAVYLR